MLTRNNASLDIATAVLLSTLAIGGSAQPHRVRMLWRMHYSGGPVLEDIGGAVVCGDGSAANGPHLCRHCRQPCVSRGEARSAEHVTCGASGVA